MRIEYKGLLDMPCHAYIDATKIDATKDELDELGLMYKPKEVPQWQVGDYAKCPDGNVRRIKSLSGNTLFCHDHYCMGTWECTRVPKPERPELNFSYFIDGDMISYKNDFSRPLESWLCFLGEGSQEYEQLIALRDWRELTGEL